MTETAQTPSPRTSATNGYYVPIDFAPWQDLVGGIPKGTVTALVGPPEAGKSTLCFQLAVETAIKESGNLLIFDTETAIHTYLALVDALEDRFEVPLNLIKVEPVIENAGRKDRPDWRVTWTMDKKPNKDCTNVFVVYCPDLTPITIMHGRGLNLAISPDSGKVKITLMDGAWAPTIGEAPFAKFIAEHKVKVVVYDSLTNPMDEIPAVGENFPARADATQIWMIQIQKIAALLNLPVLATVHESKNDTNPFNKQLKVEGGKGIGYNLKFVVYMMKEKDNSLTPKGTVAPPPLPFTGRYLWVMRHPRKPGWQTYKAIELTDQAFVPLEVS